MISKFSKFVKRRSLVIRHSSLVIFLFLNGLMFADGPARVLIVTGAGGEAAYEKRFQEWAQKLSAALQASSGGAREVAWLGDPTGEKATRESMLKALERLKASSPSEDATLIFLIGHASFDGTQYRFNLLGPDITQDELERALEGIVDKVALVALTSSSGALADKMAAPGRVIVATSRSTEKFPPEFPRFFVEALDDGAADTNKNGEVSLLEAYQYARIKTEEWYRSANRLATEHAVLEDNGDGKPTADPSPANGEGLVAAAIGLARWGPAGPATPAGGVLVQRRRALEAQLEQLKYKKATLPEVEYEKQLQALLVELAELNRKIREQK